MPKGSSSSNSNVGLFEAFFEGWLVRQEHYLDELVSTMQHCHESSDDDIKELISRVLAHYQQYYEEKSRVAQRNIFLFFSPTWFTPFEQTFLWVAGFKPALVLRVANDSVEGMTREQEESMGRLREETKQEEKMLYNEFARVQESVAAPPLLELARLRGRIVGGDMGQEEVAAIRTLNAALETVVASADMLRTRTVLKVVDILNPVQNLTFLTAATQLQIRIRSWGLQNDNLRQFRRGLQNDTLRQFRRPR